MLFTIVVDVAGFISSFSAMQLGMYTKAIDFHVLILLPATSQNSVINSSILLLEMFHSHTHKST